MPCRSLLPPWRARGTVLSLSIFKSERNPVTLILASRPNVYASSPLDRIATRREDHAWIEQQLHNPESLFVPVWRNRNLVTGMDAGTPEAVYISGETAAKLRMSNGPW